MADPLPPLVHLTAQDVRAAMPPIDERLRLAELTMTALATPGAAQLPSKIGVEPRPGGSFAHAMPAHLRAPDGDEGGDLLGIKWVTGFPTNDAVGLPAISAMIVLSDAATGVPVAIIDGALITAQRTAAVSGVAIARYAAPVAERAARVAIVGAGAQGDSHMTVVAHLVPGAELRVHDVNPERAEVLAARARGTAGIGSAHTTGSVRDAVTDADIVITAASFTSPERRQSMPGDWLDEHALVVPVDYATLVSAETARAAGLFLVDERAQFLANRAAGQFDGYPDPTATLGEAILAGTQRPPSRRVVVTHLGVGLADVIFGSAVLARARELGLGRTLPR